MSGVTPAPVKPYRALAVTFNAFCRLSSTARRAGSVASFSCARVAVRACRYNARERLLQLLSPTVGGLEGQSTGIVTRPFVLVTVLTLVRLCLTDRSADLCCSVPR